MIYNRLRRFLLFSSPFSSIILFIHLSQLLCYLRPCFPLIDFPCSRISLVSFLLYLHISTLLSFVSLTVFHSLCSSFSDTSLIVPHLPLSICTRHPPPFSNLIVWSLFSCQFSSFVRSHQVAFICPSSHLTVDAFPFFIVDNKQLISHLFDSCLFLNVFEPLFSLATSKACFKMLNHFKYVSLFSCQQRFFLSFVTPNCIGKRSRDSNHSRLFVQNNSDACILFSFDFEICTCGRIFIPETSIAFNRRFEFQSPLFHSLCEIKFGSYLHISVQPSKMIFSCCDHLKAIRKYKAIDIFYFWKTFTKLG